MSVIRLQEMTPQIYTEESRDFQLLSRLYDSVFNGLKFDTDSILDLIDTKECRTSVLQLLQTKLGFFTERKIDDEKLRSILECFPILVRNKGSLRAIKETLYLFLRMYSVSSNMEIYYLPTPYSPPFSEEEPCVLASGKLPENNSLVIRIHSFETKPDTSVMEEIFKYILPAGINYYIEFDKGATLQDIVLKSEDSAELTFVSDNINSQLRSSDQTEPYNIGTVNTSSLISTDSYVSNRFIGYYGDEQSASDYLATLVDKIYSTAVINYSATGEVSGPIVSISDAEAGAPVEALSIEVEPIQDLHGYDNPWPAGGGKNKFDAGENSSDDWTNTDRISAVNAETSSVSFVIKPSGLTYAYRKSQFSGGQAYSISGVKTNAGCRLCIRLRKADDSGWMASGDASISGWTYNSAYSGWYKDLDNSGTSFSASATIPSCLYVNFGFGFNNNKGAVVGEVETLSSIQIELGSTATAYSPYSNICPIYGHTDADVVRTGKNLFDSSVFLTASGWTETDGVYSGSCINIQYRTIGYLLELPNLTEQITLSFKGYVNYENSRAGYFRIYYNDDTQSLVEFIGKSWKNYSLTSTAGKVVVGIGFTMSNARDISLKDFQVELGSTASSYSAFVGTTYPIPLGQTVYGGVVDAVTGVLTVDRVFETITKDSAWYSFKTGTGNSSAVIQLSEWQNVKFVEGISSRNGAISSTGVELQNYWTNAREYDVCADMGFAYNVSGQIRFHRSDVANITDLASFKANFPDTQIVYYLATPTTIQLTPQQVELLQGQNNLWSDAGDISITYKRDGTYKAMICTAYSSNTPTWYRINFLGNLTTEEVSTQGGIVSALQAKGITVNNGDLIKYNNLYLLRVNNDWQECNYARYILNTYHLTE